MTPQEIVDSILTLAADSAHLPDEVLGLLHLAAGCVAGIPCQPRTATGRWATVERADTAEAHLVEFERVAYELHGLGRALKAAQLARQCAKIARAHLDVPDITRRATAIMQTYPLAGEPTNVLVDLDTTYCIVHGEER